MTDHIQTRQQAHTVYLNWLTISSITIWMGRHSCKWALIYSRNLSLHYKCSHYSRLMSTKSDVIYRTQGNQSHIGLLSLQSFNIQYITFYINILHSVLTIFKKLTHSTVSVRHDKTYLIIQRLPKVLYRNIWR